MVKGDPPKDTKFDSLDPRLMRPPFRLLVIAPTGGGKGVVIQNMLFNDQFYRDMFDLIVYVSPTIHEDRTASHMREMEDDKLILRDDVENLDRLLTELIDMQGQSDNKDRHTLLVLDDTIGLIKAGSKINSAIMSLRHHRISVIMVTQYYKGVSPRIRVNTSAFVFFKNANRAEVKKVIDELSGQYEDFEKYYRYATKSRFSFLFVDGTRLYKNFTTLLYDNDTGFRANLSDSEYMKSEKDNVPSEGQTEGEAVEEAVEIKAPKPKRVLSPEAREKLLANLERAREAKRQKAASREKVSSL